MKVCALRLSKNLQAGKNEAWKKERKSQIAAKRSHSMKVDVMAEQGSRRWKGRAAQQCRLLSLEASLQNKIKEQSRNDDITFPKAQ